jgi:ABC-type sulfate transport system permease component
LKTWQGCLMAKNHLVHVPVLLLRLVLLLAIFLVLLLVLVLWKAPFHGIWCHFCNQILLQSLDFTVSKDASSIPRGF